MPKELEPTTEAYIAMLSQIAGEVEEWCCSEECTTLDAVRLLKAEWMRLRGEMDKIMIERKYFD